MLYQFQRKTEGNQMFYFTIGNKFMHTFWLAENKFTTGLKVQYRDGRFELKRVLFVRYLSHKTRNFNDHLIVGVL